MIIKITSKQSYSLIEILGDNGEPASPQNPIDETTELKEIDFPEVNGALGIVSGMPVTAVAAVVAKYKNAVGAIAVANPRLSVAFVVHSTNPQFPMGSSIPLQ